MRKSGQAKAAKKAGRIAAEGVIFARTEGNVAVMIELNCETDFVSKGCRFPGHGSEDRRDRCYPENRDVDALKAADFGNGESVELTITNLIAKIGENMNLRRVMLVEGDNLGTYVHGSRIGVITKLVGGTDEGWPRIWPCTLLPTARNSSNRKTCLPKSLPKSAKSRSTSPSTPASRKRSPRRWLKAA